MTTAVRHPRTLRVANVLALLPLVALVLACGWGAAPQVTSRARWACPSPLPQPFGPAGPVKTYEQLCDTDPTTGQQTCQQRPVYYEEWEQEYGTLGGPPFPSPTPYGFNGRSFVFGQRVEVAPFHLAVTATAGPVVQRDGIAPNTQQLYHVQIDWASRAPDAVPFDYGAQVLLRGVTGANGAVITGATWGTNALAREVSGSSPLPTTISPGSSSVTVPIIGPIGQPKIVDVRFGALVGGAAVTPTQTLVPAAPTLTATGTATNGDLRASWPETLTVQWVNSGFDYYGAPPCNDPGALTDWGDGLRPIEAPNAPAGASRVVQIALNQVGKPYVWGAKGPNTFDCSGLASWSYAQIGIGIPNGTANQFPGMRVVSTAELQPGDLVYMNTEEPRTSRVTHVMMMAGDLNGNGQWDVVHAASPRLGVRIDYDIFQSPYYAPRLLGFRTAR